MAVFCGLSIGGDLDFAKIVAGVLVKGFTSLLSVVVDTPPSNKDLISTVGDENLSRNGLLLGDTSAPRKGLLSISFDMSWAEKILGDTGLGRKGLLSIAFDTS
jgi:hypothetical protein